MKQTYLVLFLLLNTFLALRLKEDSKTPPHISEITTSDHLPQTALPVRYTEKLTTDQNKLDLSAAPVTQKTVTVEVVSKKGKKKKVTKPLENTLSSSSLDPTPRSQVIQIGIPPAEVTVENFNYKIDKSGKQQLTKVRNDSVQVIDSHEDAVKDVAQE